MFNQKWIVILIFVVISLSVSACCPNCPTAQPCPPYGSYVKESIPGEASSIELYVNTIAKADNGQYWCYPSKPTIQVADLTGAPACPLSKGCLKAVDVQPNNLSFSETMTLSDRPTLTFDLSAHPTAPKDTCVNNYCYVIYQLNTSNNTWRNVGSAKDIGSGLAAGNINHFTIFAIAELPASISLPGPGNLSLQVASQFTYSSDGSLIDVAFAVRDNDFGLTLEEHILRLVDVDPKFTVFDPNAIPAECTGINPLDQWLTCVFPVDTPVTVTIENQNVPIDNYLRFIITHENAGFTVELVVRQIFAY